MSYSSEELDRLYRECHAARANAYCPYSKFRVGAAVLTHSGKSFRGCNVENAAYPSGVCAERIAIGNAVVNGARDIRVIGVVCDIQGSFVTPCGFCRQCIIEFGKDVDIVCFDGGDAGSGGGAPKYQIYNVKDLLPHAFDHTMLEQAAAVKNLSA